MFCSLFWIDNIKWKIVKPGAISTLCRKWETNGFKILDSAIKIAINMFKQIHFWSLFIDSYNTVWGKNHKIEMNYKCISLPTDRNNLSGDDKRMNVYTHTRMYTCNHTHQELFMFSVSKIAGHHFIFSFVLCLYTCIHSYVYDIKKLSPC